MNGGAQQNTGAPQRANRLLLGKLYEKTSQSGQKFFIGSLGFLKVLVFHDDNAESGNEWNFYVVERTQDEIRQRREYAQQQQGQNASQGAPGQAAGGFVGQGQGYGAQQPARQQQQPQQRFKQLPPEGADPIDEIPF